MPPFVQTLNIADVNQIVAHFQNIPDIMEYILESDRYPLAALNEVLETLQEAKDHQSPERQGFEEFTRTITKIESVIATRVDYVNSIIEHLLGRETFETPNLSLDHSPTKEILFHIDLLKDVAHSSEINQDDYKAALRKLTKTLNFRFNKGLEIHKKLAHLEYEAIAARPQDFSQTVLEAYKEFVQDALTLTRIHVSVMPLQVQQLKETLLKILEAMGMRILQTELFHSRAEYLKTLNAIEDVIIGHEGDVGKKLAQRFAGMRPEEIAAQRNVYVIKHNRKFAELLIDLSDDVALLQELYQVLLTLTTAEATQLLKKSGISQATPPEEPAQAMELEQFNTLEISEKARELIRVSLYGLCHHLATLSMAELQKYPIGIIRSTEKVMGDLEQHRLRTSDIRAIQHFPNYLKAVETIKQALATYNAADKKYDFVDIYQETDYTVNRVTFCMFNDPILRGIQNITEAYFVVDAKAQEVSQHRQEELQVTLVERYKAEWARQKNRP